MAELQYNLNRLAGTTGLDAQRAANIWAGTSGKDLVGAVNAKAGLPTATYSSTGNVLSLNQSSFTAGDTGGWAPTQGTAAYDGRGKSTPGSLKVTQTSGAFAFIGLSVGAVGSAGDTYTISASVYTDSADVTGFLPYFVTNLGQRTGTGSRAVTRGAWTTYTWSYTLIATEYIGEIRVILYSTGTPVTLVDEIGLWKDSGGTWAPGGYPITLSATGTKDLDGALNAVAGTTNLDANAASDACLTSKVNLIPANGASFETDASYWDINASLTKAVDTSTFAAGNQSLKVTMNVAGGDLGIKGFTPGSNIACTAGNTYTFVASFLKGSGSRQNYYIYGEWRNAGNTTISTFQSTKITANTWSEARVTATAPALTTSVQLWFIVFDTGISTDTWWVDKIGMWQDNPTAQWSL